MNETLFVYLNLDVNESEKNELLIQRIDDLLEGAGMKYSGYMNMYLPVEDHNRDHAVYAAGEALKNAKWLKGIFSRGMIGTRTNVCSLDEILTDYMSEPAPEKMKYYESFYLRTKTLAHGIVVDERRQLRDGYISYLLAKKYEAAVEIYEAFSCQPLLKIVVGRHAEYTQNKWMPQDNKMFHWSYPLKKAVVPGDILQVHTQKGLAFICVDRIEYATGKDFCKLHNRVKQHIGMHIG